MNAMRMTFLTMAAIMLAGIGLTGFGKVHWLLYLPPAFLLFAGLTGVCPGLIFWSRAGLRNEALACEFSRKKPE